MPTHHSDPEPAGCLGRLLVWLGIQTPAAAKASQGPLPYRVREDFLSPTERSFYGVLKMAVGDRAVICPKVRLADLFFVPNRKEHPGAQNKIDRKHIDFLLCHPESMRPLLGIELDDASHQEPKRIERVAFLDSAFEAAEFPLLRCPVRASYDLQALIAELENVLTAASRPGPAAIPVAPQADAPPTCPKCGIPMVRRIASQGPRKGNPFWGCANYPNCRQTA